MEPRDEGQVGDGGQLGQATRIIGGVMLGAGLAALIQLLVPAGPGGGALQPMAALFAATLCILFAWKLGRAGDTADAAGLAAATSVPFLGHAPAPLGLVVAGLAVFVTLAQRGRSPLALLAASTFFVGLRHAAGVDLLLGDAALPVVALFLGLLGYGAWVATQRDSTQRDSTQRGSAWSGRAVALVAVFLVLTGFPLLDAAGVTDAGVASLCLGTLIGALLAAGLALRVPALAKTMGSILPVAIVAFALLALGPALAAIVLLLLGAALLWQAEHVRVLLRRRAA